VLNPSSGLVSVPLLGEVVGDVENSLLSSWFRKDGHVFGRWKSSVVYKDTQEKQT